MEKFQLWCKSFEEAKREPMSMELSKIFLNVNLMEINKAIELNNPDFELLMKDFLYQVIDKRSEYIGLKLNPYTKIFLALLSRSPGTAVMYLYYLKYKHTDDSVMDMTKLTMLFPVGFPPDVELDRLWDEQKVDEKNLLDIIN